MDPRSCSQGRTRQFYPYRSVRKYQLPNRLLHSAKKCTLGCVTSYSEIKGSLDAHKRNSNSPIYRENRNSPISAGQLIHGQSPLRVNLCRCRSPPFFRRRSRVVILPGIDEVVAPVEAGAPQRRRRLPHPPHPVDHVRSPQRRGWRRNLN